MYDEEIPSLPAPFSEIKCLAQAIYHEAWGESNKGKLGVAHVVLNRVDSGRFPSTICNVVYQKVNAACQFTWVCLPGKLKREPPNEAVELALTVLHKKTKDPTNGALFFHASHLDFRFNRKQTAVIGNHIFYK